jgi:hypothetical protein
MKKIILLTTLFCISFLGVRAQLGVGLRGGYTFSSTSQELVNGMSRTLGTSNSFGLIVAYDLDLHFSAAMEFNHVTLSEGLKYNASFFPLDTLQAAVTTTPSLSYLQIPILGRVNFGTKKYKAFLSFGPYVGIGLKGNWENGPRSKNKGSWVEFDSTYSDINFGTNELKRFDLGGMVGFGGQYQVEKSGYIFIEARVQLGFLDFYQKRSDFQKGGFTSKTNKYLIPSGSWRFGNISLGYVHTFKLPKKKSSAASKKAGKQKRK